MARGPIVVGVDGTESSFDALRFAANLAARDRADDGLDLVVVHVRVRPWMVTSQTVAPVTETADTIARDAEDEVKRALYCLPVTWRWVLREGDVARELVKVAAEEDARAIAVGGHQHGKLTAAMLRSVEARLMHHYSGTLYAVRPDPRPARAPVPVEPAASARSTQAVL